MNENNNTYVAPARFRLMQQEEFVRKFHKHVISHLNVYEGAVCRNEYELAEKLQKALRDELVNAIAVIDGNTALWGMKQEFTKEGGQNLLCE